MSADKFRGRMYDNIGSVFNGTDQIGGRKGRVHHQRNLVSVCDFCNGFQVYQVGIRIPKSFYENGFCICLNCGLKGIFCFRIDKGCVNVVCQREGMGQQIVSASVDGLRCYNMLKGFC